MVAEEGHHGRDHHDRAEKRCSQRLAARPRPRSRTFAGSGGCTSSTGRPRSSRTTRRCPGPVALVRVGRLGDELLDAREEPPVERLEVTGFDAGRDVRVVDEELRAVPERQQPALDLVRRPVAEVDVLARHLLAEHEAHDVGAHLLERLGRPRSRCPSTCASRARLVADALVREHPLVRRAPDQRHRHERHRVEPQADLLAALRDPLGRKPLLPVPVVRQIGARQAAGGARRVPARDGLRRSASRASRKGRCRRRATRPRPP